MGYAGNAAPQFIIPTVSSTRKGTIGSNAATAGSAAEDFDVLIGEEAYGRSKSHTHLLQYPVRHGQVENWDLMEAYWGQCLFRYLRCDPSEHALLLTEPPLNAPENREYTAEIMFESFNVPQLYIAVQAVLSLAASWMDARATDKTSNPLTGCVVDSGDGVTHIIPVVEGYAIGSAIKHIPVAGREVTLLLQQLLRERPDLRLPGEETLEIARRIKEELCYVCPDLAREFIKYDAEPEKWIRTFTYASPGAGSAQATSSFEVGPERFLAPEVFFNPEMSGTGAFTTPLPNLIDECIQASPIDCRRGLYGNIVLSGGSTMFRDFGKRLQRDLKNIVDERLAYTVGLETVNGGGEGKAAAAKGMAVNVVAHLNQRYAVWAGGSLFASMDQFPAYCTSKAEYDEHGPSICRQSRVFGSLLA